MIVDLRTLLFACPRHAVTRSRPSGALRGRAAAGATRD
jgi:hypothetical protein